MSRTTSTSIELERKDFLDANLFTDLAQGEESFEAIAEGTIQPAEPDVGIMSPYCEDVAVIYRGVDLLDALTEKARERAEDAVGCQYDDERRSAYDSWVDLKIKERKEERAGR